MGATLSATIAYAGSLIPEQIGTSPWTAQGLRFPEHGNVPFFPQFIVDMLQPENTDGARYRVGGRHFVRFQMVSIVGADNFDNASVIGREHEACKGDYITVQFRETTYRLYAHEVKAFSNPMQILGAVQAGTLSAQQTACVDTLWSLQSYAL